MSASILVTGATGHLGQLVARKLTGRVPTDQVSVCTRDPRKAAGLAALGVRVHQADFDDPGSLPPAFEGVRQVLLVSSNARAYGGDPLAQHRTAIEAARAAGVERIVYTSQMAASPSSAFPPMHDHAATEDMLRASGVAWTALGHGFYGSSALAILGNALKTGELETAEDGPFSWVTHDDLAEADAILLTDEAGRYDGPTPPLTGAEALDFGDLADLASELLDRPVRRTILSDDEMRTRLAERGMPPHVVDISMGMYVGARNGEWATVDPTLGRLLGRPPASIRHLMAEEVG